MNSRPRAGLLQKIALGCDHLGIPDRIEWRDSFHLWTFRVSFRTQSHITPAQNNPKTNVEGSGTETQ
jgi:hypothetical protein